MIQESPAFRHGECQERAHIRPVLDYLKLLYSPCNELAFWNLFELVDGVGPKRVRAIFDSFRENHQCDIEDLAKLSIPKKAGDDFQKLSYALQEGKAFLDSNPEADDEISVLQYLCKTFLEGFFYEKNANQVFG